MNKTNKICLPLLVLCLIPTFILCQTNRDSLADIYVWNQISPHYQQTPPDCKAIIQQLKKINSDKEPLYEIYGNLYIIPCLQELGRVQESKVVIDQTYQLIEQLKENSKLDFSNIYSNLHFISGRFYYEHRLDYATSIFYYEQCKELIENGAVLFYSKNDLLNNLGLIYEKVGDYQVASEYLLASIDTTTENYKGLAINYNNIAINALKREDYSKALPRLQQAKQFLDSLGYADYTKNIYADVYNNLGRYYTETDQVQKAHNYLNQAKISEINDNKRKLTNYKNRALAFLAKKNYPEAILYIDKAIDSYFRDSITHYRIGMLYHIYGDIYQATNQHKKALSYYQKALVVFGKNFNNKTSTLQNPKEASFGLEVDLLKTLEAKATSLKQIGQYKLALSTYQQADKIFDKLRAKNLNNTRSKYYWVSKTKSLYGKAIDLAEQLGEKELAYQFCQKSHATVLWEMLQSIDAKNLGNIPDSLIKKEHELKLKIASEEIKSNSSDTIQEQLFSNKRELVDLQKKLEKEYPIYYKIKYELPITDIQSIQQNLNKETTLLEYFIGEEIIYIFYITKDSFKIYKKAKDINFLSHLFNLRKSISHYDESRSAFDTFTASAYALYEVLLKDVLVDNLNKQLIIIPDEELGYLNFGLLLNNPQTNFSRYDKLPYLVKQYDIGYNYSSALFAKLQNSQTKKNNLNTFVGFAPTFSGSPSVVRQGQLLDSLIYNLPEVEYIQSIVGGEIHTGTSATLANFKNSNQKCKIGHFATHATCDDINPERSTIHFVDTTLSCNEIYNLKLNYELVVLSACETGKGKLQKGEGIISLARAFISAGCPSVVTSLWSVNDKSTANIMRLFYQNLSTKQPKHEALANAQRTYLKQPTTTTSFAHPFYWGAFIPIGNMDTISTNSFPIGYWIVGAIIFLLLLLLLLRTNK